MATKKSMWIIFSILVISAWVFGVVQAGAETLKCRTAGVVTKDETLPVGFEEGHVLGLQITEGLALFENGEIATYRSTLVYDRYDRVVPGKSSQAIGYTIFTFNDGATIVQRFQRLQGPDKTIPAQVASELIKGTGRFEGIKGSISGTSKRAPEVKGEAKKYVSDMIFTFTLPSK
jgi:Na+/H+-translocating membrane pyrophosphatase